MRTVAPAAGALPAMPGTCSVMTGCAGRKSNRGHPGCHSVVLPRPASCSISDHGDLSDRSHRGQPQRRQPASRDPRLYRHTALENDLTSTSTVRPLKKGDVDSAAIDKPAASAVLVSSCMHYRVRDAAKDKDYRRLGGQARRPPGFHPPGLRPLIDGMAGWP